MKRRIGAGGFGIVYEALDRERGVDVALKTLARLDAAALYRFKREFRGLADVRHRNLVELHELVSHDTEWVLVMELVRGGDCFEYVRGAVAKDAPTLVAPPGSLRACETIAAKTDLARLRDVLAQLVEGVSALHTAGKLHRDIKPSNVLVEAETGRVVVVDFGITTELGEKAGQHSDQNAITGTPEYMAPEQGTARRAGGGCEGPGALFGDARSGRC